MNSKQMHALYQEKWTVNRLSNMATIHVGHTCDLKYETGTVRIWLARTGVADGEPYNNKVTIERLIEGQWATFAQFPAG